MKFPVLKTVSRMHPCAAVCFSIIKSVTERSAHSAEWDIWADTESLKLAQEDVVLPVPVCA